MVSGLPQTTIYLFGKGGILALGGVTNSVFRSRHRVESRAVCIWPDFLDQAAFVQSVEDPEAHPFRQTSPLDHIAELEGFSRRRKRPKHLRRMHDRLHDVTITVGVFSLLDKDFTLPIIAALLTIIGYSLNDTIIVFDRIRENTRKHLRQPYDWVVNRSINETLSRTLLTSLTTLVVVLALLLFVGASIQNFAVVLVIGVIAGTYSSICIAPLLLVAWEGE